MLGASEEGGDNTALWGALGAAAIGYAGSQKTNKESKEVAQLQMDFQERMSNSAYQRAVADMKKAGINPMMVTQVGGATSPAGTMPQIQNSLSSAVSSAKQGANTVHEIQQAQQTQATTQNIAAQTDKIKSETLQKDLHTALKMAQIDAENEKAGLTAWQRKHEVEKIDRTKLDTDVARTRHGEHTIGGGYQAEVERKLAETEDIKNALSRSRAEEKFWESDIGKQFPYIRSIIEILRGVSSARHLAR